MAEKGFSTTVFALFLPTILSVLALCADGAVVIYYRISLGTAADAASLAAIDSYDRDIWYNEGRVVLQEERAEELARENLRDNLPEAELIHIEVLEEEPHTCEVKVQIEAPLFFLPMFGIDAKTITMTSLAHGYE